MRIDAYMEVDQDSGWIYCIFFLLLFKITLKVAMHVQRYGNKDRGPCPCIKTKVQKKKKSSHHHHQLGTGTTRFPETLFQKQLILKNVKSIAYQSSKYSEWFQPKPIRCESKLVSLVYIFNSSPYIGFQLVLIS